MEQAPSNTPNPFESKSTSPPNSQLEDALRYIADVVALDDAMGNGYYDNGDTFTDQKTDELFNPMGEENPELLAEVLLELACSDNSAFHEIAGNNVGYLYGMNPDLGRPLWELMVTTEGTHDWAESMLRGYMIDDPDDPLTRRQIEDYAAIKRRADEHEAQRQSK